MDSKEIVISVDSDPQTRKGVYSDAVTAKTRDGVTCLDFLQRDIEQEDGNVRGILAARIVMANTDLVALRDMLDTHIANHIYRADEHE